MIIEWLGQACFILTLTGGGHLLIDPVPPQLGYHTSPASVDADLTIVSHLHSDHNYVAMAKKLVEISPATGPDDASLGWKTYTVAGHHTIRIERIFAYHDNAGGTKRGPDTMTVIEADGLRVAHLGDLGQLALTPDQLQKLGHVDILMLPVGGFFTIDGPQAAAIVAQIHPRVIIPIHYATPALTPDLKSKLAPADAFLAAMRPQADIVEEQARDLTLTRNNLPKRETVYVLRYE